MKIIPPLEQIVQELRNAIPAGVRELPKDLEQTFKTILQQAFNRLDLVTREEFDAQVAVLQRTRQKLEHLEQSLARLESQKQTASDHPSPDQRSETTE